MKKEEAQESAEKNFDRAEDSLMAARHTSEEQAIRAYQTDAQVAALVGIGYALLAIAKK